MKYYDIETRKGFKQKKVCKLMHTFLNKYWRRELNPHPPYSEQDFKSCVSTNSTTPVTHTNS